MDTEFGKLRILENDVKDQALSKTVFKKGKDMASRGDAFFWFDMPNITQIIKQEYLLFSDAPVIEKNSVMYTVESQTTLETYKVTGKCPDLTVKYS